MRNDPHSRMQVGRSMQSMVWHVSIRPSAYFSVYRHRPPSVCSHLNPNIHYRRDGLENCRSGIGDDWRIISRVFVPDDPKSRHPSSILELKSCKGVRIFISLWEIAAA